MPELSLTLPDGWTVTAAPPALPPPVVVPPVTTGQRRPAPAKGVGLFVSGNKIFDANGMPFVMRGINASLAWGWTEHNFASIKEISETGANAIRCVVDTGFPLYADHLDEVLTECVRNRLVPVVGAWMATSKDEVAALNACVDYWLRPANVTALKKFERHVVLNVANEWGGSGPVGFDGARWRSTYALALERIRAAGINCLVLIDAGGASGQNPRSIRDYGAGVVAADPNHNVAFGLHLYQYWRSAGQAGVGTWDDSGTKSPWRVADELQAIAAKGLPLIIGEIGGGGALCPYVTSEVLATLKSMGLGWLAWSWNQNKDSSLDFIANGGYLFDGVASVTANAKVFFDSAVGFASGKPATTW